MEQGAARRVPRALERGGMDTERPVGDQQQQPGGPGTGPVQLDYTLELKTITEKRIVEEHRDRTICSLFAGTCFPVLESFNQEAEDTSRVPDTTVQTKHILWRTFCIVSTVVQQ
ncbi:hypothetical protein D4764_09G0002580 [Takifugu flavidus]|uniref:Uncharacterized protein n=1 Tax=Takifugu flavidus TaxID=433684 RepID=A0A5C6MK83_9TELE|nr:hypothetical protein D4764_09G0002580 [Takifugu flavidus]